MVADRMPEFCYAIIVAVVVFCIVIPLFADLLPSPMPILAI